MLKAFKGNKAESRLKIQVRNCFQENWITGYKMEYRCIKSVSSRSAISQEAAMETSRMDSLLLQGANKQ